MTGQHSDLVRSLTKPTWRRFATQQCPPRFQEDLTSISASEKTVNISGARYFCYSIVHRTIRLINLYWHASHVRGNNESPSAWTSILRDFISRFAPQASSICHQFADITAEDIRHRRPLLKCNARDHSRACSIHSLTEVAALAMQVSMSLPFGKPESLQ